VDVAEVGRKAREHRLDVGAVAIPVDEGAHREAVAVMGNSP
jgi:hypothetical protein